jgi:hypothetical protein
VKLLLTMAGTYKYDKSKVYVPWCPSAESAELECYPQGALQRALQPNKTWLVCTEAAIEAVQSATRDPVGDTLAYDRHLRIPDGRTEAELWEVFGIISAALAELQDQNTTEVIELHLDVTMGFRVQPMFLTSAVRYVAALESGRIKVQGIYYSNHNKAKEESLLLRVTPILEMEDVARDVHALLAYSTTEPLRTRLDGIRTARTEALKRELNPTGELSQEELGRQCKASQRADQVHQLLGRLTEALPDFGAVVALNITPLVAKAAQRLCDEAEAASQLFENDLKPVGQALAVLRRDLMALLPGAPGPLWHWHAALAKWCLERGLIQQALTHAEELPTTRRCEELGRNPLVADDRTAVGEPLKELCSSREAPPVGWQPFIHAWKLVSEHRNPVNHAHTGKAASKQKPGDQLAATKAAVQELLASMTELASLRDLQDRPGLDQLLHMARDQVQSLWKPQSQARFQALLTEAEQRFPYCTLDTKWLRQLAEEVGTLKERAYQAGQSGRDNDLAFLLGKASTFPLNGLANTLRFAFESGQTAAARRKAERKNAMQGLPLSTVTPRSIAQQPTKPIVAQQSPAMTKRLPTVTTELHANDIRALQPAKHWALLLDETGSEFAEVHSTRAAGRLVGLLVPQGGPEPAIQPLAKDWHAVACSDPAEIDAAVQQVLDAPCGVIGFPVTALPEVPGERWLDGIRAVVDWVVRVLPLAGDTRLKVVIEARPPYKSGRDLVLARDLKAQLARSWPDRARLVDIQVEFAGKGGHPLLPHVDALAFTWGSPTKTSAERLRRSGLLGSCLLNFSAAELTACWDAWDSPGGIAPAQWAKLVAQPEASQLQSVTHAILAALADACRQDLPRWTAYLQEASRHLFQGPVPLQPVAAMVRWLDGAKPSSAEIPPALQLVWRTAQLAQANHMGATEQAWKQELFRLSQLLLEEAAPLCCHADLHLAVAATNRFDFEFARQLLSRWDGVPRAVPGLRLWGQWRSSIGQLHAFGGRPDTAQVAFAEALQAFALLSDTAVRDKELDQTLCYAAIAAIDDSSCDDAATAAALERWLGPLESATLVLAGSGDGDRYRQHALLRWLVRGSRPDFTALYLAQRGTWQVGDGHPWPLICLYRGMLLREHEPKAALDLALEAHAIASSPDQGPTVQLIGAVCRAVAVAWGEPWTKGEVEVARLRGALPAAAARLDVLAGFLAAPAEPMALLAGALPFNFR